MSCSTQNSHEAALPIHATSAPSSASSCLTSTFPSSGFLGSCCHNFLPWWSKQFIFSLSCAFLAARTVCTRLAATILDARLDATFSANACFSHLKLPNWPDQNLVSFVLDVLWSSFRLRFQDQCELKSVLHCISPFTWANPILLTKVFASPTTTFLPSKHLLPPGCVAGAAWSN